MSVLTKVFVVLVSLLSVVLVALIVPFVATTQDYKDQLGRVVTERDVAQAKARGAQAEVSAAQDSFSQQIATLEARNTSLVAQINQLMEQLALAEGQAQRELSKNVKFEADLGRLTAANQQQGQLLNQLQSEVQQRRQQTLDQQSEMVQLANRNNELEGQLEALQRRLRRANEQSTDLQGQNQQLKQQLATLPPEQFAKTLAEEDAQPRPYEPQTLIKGRVTGIKSFEGDTFVQIDVGGNDGVAPNMKFLVHRGNQFLGTLIISTVDQKAAAGRLKVQQGNVQVGDGVLTGGM